MNDLKIENKLRKLLALAEGGVGGEKTNAQGILDKLLKKHNLTISDISDEAIDTYWFKYKGKLERRLLNQVIGSVNKNADRWRSSEKREQIGADVTKHQMLKIGLKFNCYKKALNNEIDLLFSAFIHTNKIFPPSCESNDDDDEIESTPEERMKWRKVANMMQGMSKTTVLNEIGVD